MGEISKDCARYRLTRRHAFVGWERPRPRPFERLALDPNRDAVAFDDAAMERCVERSRDDPRGKTLDRAQAVRPPAAADAGKDALEDADGDAARKRRREDAVSMTAAPAESITNFGEGLVGGGGDRLVGVAHAGRELRDAGGVEAKRRKRGQRVAPADALVAVVAV